MKITILEVGVAPKGRGHQPCVRVLPLVVIS